MTSTPKFGLIECDHIILRPKSLEEGCKTFEKLGFHVRLSLAPGSQRQQLAAINAEEMPINNAIVGVTAGTGSIEYLELMTPNDPQGLHPCMNVLGDSEGLKSMVVRLESLEKFTDGMRGAGLTVYDSLRDLGRDFFSERALKKMGNYDLWEGALKSFLSPIMPKTGCAPFYYNGYQVHIDFEAYMGGFSQDKASNPNTAIGFVAAFGMSNDVKTDAAHQADCWETQPEFRDDGTAVVHMGERFSLEIFDQKDADRLFPGIEFSRSKIAPYMCGSRVTVESLDTLKRVLKQNGVPFLDAEAAVRVQPADACSMMIEFTEA